MNESELLNKLPDTLRDRMIRLRSAFESSGWSVVSDEFREQADAWLRRIADAKDWAEANYARGQRDAYLRMAGYEVGAWNEMEALVLDQEQPQEDDDADL